MAGVNRIRSPHTRFRSLLFCAALGLAVSARAGVTFITHGLNGNTDGWVTGMATRIATYPRFPGTNFSCYKVYFYQSAGEWYLTAMRVDGAAPQAADSGEIIVKFDWSQLADGNSFDTYQIAAAASAALLSTNLIPELGGRALVAFPLHLIGHSRGGSLVCELSRLLGTNGVWVDHLTTLDPHPLNNDGFDLDWILYSDVDAPARTYANVLFHDNCWQDLSWPIYGKTVSGSYSRRLTSLGGGYASAHSDAHLWYHGTIDFGVPADDTEALLNGTERSVWWNAFEAQGTNAGYVYSRIGGGNRLSMERPQGTGFPMINSGYNQNWDFGAGQAGNRTALTTNNGAWPSLIQCSRVGTNPVIPGMSADLKIFYQWAGTATNGTIRVYLDADLNPLNGNESLLKEVQAAGTGTPGFIGVRTISLPIAAASTQPRSHALLVVISAAGRTRYLYAPERIQIIGAPVLQIAQSGSEQIDISVSGAPGQTVILQTSVNLIDWQPVLTNTLASSLVAFTNVAQPGALNQFYRAQLVPPSPLAAGHR